MCVRVSPAGSHERANDEGSGEVMLTLLLFFFFLLPSGKAQFGFGHTSPHKICVALYTYGIVDL